MHSGGRYPATLIMAAGRAQMPEPAKSPLATAGTNVSAPAALTIFHPSTIVLPMDMLMLMGAPRKNGSDMELGRGMNRPILWGSRSRARLTSSAKINKPARC